MQEFKHFVTELAAASGKIICSHFRAPLSVDTKTDDSPVTVADRNAESLMRELIQKRYPSHGIIGEEFGIENPDAEFTWILDPIDGTKSFICGALSFGTLIALRQRDDIILGAFHQPVLGELLIGDGNRTELNGAPVRCRPCTDLSQAVLLTTDHLNIARYRDIHRFESLTRKVRLYRNWGDCYGYYLLATGFADIMIDPIMSLWDTCALLPIVRGAGGVITDYHGGDPLNGNSTIATAGGIHNQVVSLLNDRAKGTPA